MASTDALPLARKNVAYRVTFAIYKNDGTLITGAAGLDSEVSKDGGTFADCTNEATEIATSSGIYYLDLTSTEMNADCVAVVVKTSSTGAVIPSYVFYPQERGDIKADVDSWLGTVPATPGTAGVPSVDVIRWSTAAVASPDTAGYPKVTIKSGTGTGEVSLSSGAVLLQATQTGVTIPTVTNLTNAPTNGDLTSTMKASVNAEVVDGLNVDTMSEMAAGAPPLAPTMRQALNYLYRRLIRSKKTVDASASPAVETVFADDGSTALFKRDISDSGNVTTFDETVSG